MHDLAFFFYMNQSNEIVVLKKLSAICFNLTNQSCGARCLQGNTKHPRAVCIMIILFQRIFRQRNGRTDVCQECESNLPALIVVSFYWLNFSIRQLVSPRIPAAMPYFLRNNNRSPNQSYHLQITIFNAYMFKGNAFCIKITMLDQNIENHKCLKWKWNCILNMYFLLFQTDYFGLRYFNKKLQFRWVELDKPLKRQLDKHGNSPLLYFGVMFYIAGAHKITDENDKVSKRIKMY